MAEQHSKNTGIESFIADFLADLKHANRSPHTLRAYATDLRQPAEFHAGSLNEIMADTLRAFLAR